MRKILLVILSFLVINSSTVGQDTSLCRSCLDKIQDDFVNKVNKKINSLESKIAKKTIRELEALHKEEARLNRILENADPAATKILTSKVSKQYSDLKKMISENLEGAHDVQYIPYLDTLRTTMAFISKQQFKSTQVNDYTGSIDGLRGRLKQTEIVSDFIRTRRQALSKALLEKGLVKQLEKFNKRVFYYSQQIQEYKQMLKDKQKVEQKALSILRNSKPYQEFMKRNSLLASLFPATTSNNVIDQTFATLQGLQTRSQVSAYVQQHSGISEGNAQNLTNTLAKKATAEAQNLPQYNPANLANRVKRHHDLEDVPDFKVNKMKTKPFLDRIEFGTNFQSQRSNSFLPATSDLGFSVGYKLDEKNVIGLGGSYKLGWGQGIQHIRFSHEGVGLRSFADWSLKGNLFLTGGYEMNYRSAFNRVAELKELNVWQQSGLVGLSKLIVLKSKLFKKTKVQLLFDFLSYQQIPKTQPLIFRIGYHF